MEEDWDMHLNANHHNDDDQEMMMMIPNNVSSTTTTGSMSPTSSSSRSSTTALIAHRRPVDPNTIRRHHLSMGLLQNQEMHRTMSATLQRYESELRFLRDQWTHICITSRSLRSSYDAVPHQDDGEDPNDDYIFPIPGTIAIDTFYVPPRRNPSRINNSHNKEEQQLADEEIAHEMLLSLDENLLQIRQLETKIEQLETRIQSLMRSMSPQ
ncbi:hypothetical protein K492DRAFT_210480 [Lichtheimia hyalospora FSU 10163]|nr:hypothetical protein K492DRAFT_210480 [Lichtheimia hyalospora FSU 10163]